MNIKLKPNPAFISSVRFFYLSTSLSLPYMYIRRNKLKPKLEELFSTIL